MYKKFLTYESCSSCSGLGFDLILVKIIKEGVHWLSYLFVFKTLKANATVCFLFNPAMIISLLTQIVKTKTLELGSAGPKATEMAISKI